MELPRKVSKEALCKWGLSKAWDVPTEHAQRVRYLKAVV